MNKPKCILLSIGALLCSTFASATDFDFSGTFAKDNDIVSLSFSVASASSVTVFSSSWDDGGFDPILAIWNSSGNLIHQQDDGHNIGSTLSNAVSYTHGTWDSYYTVNLAAGTYTATIAQYDNFAVSTLLSGGFIYDSSPHFTFTNNYGPQADFNGVDNVGRNGNWVFHLLNVDTASSSVPDATSTFALLGLGVAAMMGLRRKQR